jgi:hypothetical protein
LSSTEADRINHELQRLAREHHGRNTQALQLLYAIEGFLRRLSLSGYRDRLVLKGAMLLAVLAQPPERRSRSAFETRSSPMHSLFVIVFT